MKINVEYICIVDYGVKTPQESTGTIINGI
jgi:hypothetical protein